jgi:DNA-binding XRE family transcriptional regulator
MFEWCQQKIKFLSLCDVTDQQMLRLFGQRVREARLKARMTQECLAELVGIHWKTVGHIERGTYSIALTTFARLSQFLETSPNRLLEGLKPPDPQRTARIKQALARKRAPCL